MSHPGAVLQTESPGEGPRRLERICYILILGYFVYQAVAFAQGIPFGLPPDERLHAYGMTLYAKAGELFPPASKLPPVVGDKSLPFPLYYQTMGLLQQVFATVGADNMLVVRLANIVLGVVNVLLCIAFLKIVLRDDPFARILACVVYANLVMFPFMYASISWDNLANTLSMLGLYLCFAFLQRKTIFLAGCFLAACGLGVVSKSTAIPVFVVLFCIMLAAFYTSRGELFLQFKQAARSWKGRAVLATTTFGAVVFLVAFMHFAGLLAAYGSITPSCAQIYSKDQCIENNHIYRKYIQLRSMQAADPAPLLDPLRHFFVWSDMMVEKMLGIFAYQSWYPAPSIVAAVELLLLFSLVQLIRTFSTSNRTLVLLLLVSLFYIAVLYGYVNYKGYLSHGIVPRYTFVGIQGRYLFPVLAPLLVLFVKGVLQPFTGRIRAVLAVGLCLFFIGIGFPLAMHENPDMRYATNPELQDAFLDNVMKSQRYVP